MDPTNPETPEVSRIFYDRGVALYCRLSRNPNGTRDSVKTQKTIGLRECAERWPGRAVHVYTDDDLSAGDDVYRPGFEAMLADIAAGKIGDVLCRVQARVSRGKRVWPRFQVICLAAGIEKLTTWETGPISMREGEDMAGDITNLFNVHHRIITKLSVRNTLDQRAREGRPSGGVKYGYEPGVNAAKEATLEVVPAEAEVLHVIAELVLAGYNQSAIAAELHARQLYRRSGKRWTPSLVKRAITNPSIAGRHTRYGKVTGIRSTWDPIIDPDLFDAVGAVLNQTRVVTDRSGRQRTYRGARRPARVYLLTGGLAVCGLCGTELRGQARHVAKTGPTYHYGCSTPKGGCGQVSVIGPPFEQYVIGRFLDHVRDPAFLEFLAAGDTDAQRRAELTRREDALRARREQVGLAVGRLELSMDAAAAAEAQLTREEARIAEERALLAPLAVSGLTPEAILVGWDYATLVERRAWMRTTQMSLRLLPAGGRRWTDGAGFPAERVELSFGGHAPAARARANARRKPKPTNSNTSRG